jgi:hypothetical protein
MITIDTSIDDMDGDEGHEKEYGREHTVAMIWTKDN